MFLEDLIIALTVVLMFFLRIGVPILITLLIGRWLEKKLAPREEPVSATLQTHSAPQVTRSGNIIQVHCWNLKRCETARRAECAAFKRPDLPCWLALQADGGKLREECFTCALYKPQSIAA